MHHHQVCAAPGAGGVLLSLLLVGEGPLVPPEAVLLDPAQVLDGDLCLLAWIAADTGARDPLALDSLMLVLEVVVGRGMCGVVRRDLLGGGLARVGAGDGDLQDRCLGRWRGGVDSVLVPGDLDLLAG